MSEPKPRFRGHTPLSRVLYVSGFILFCAAIAVFNGFWVHKGLTTGAIKSLRQRSHELVFAATDPGWFWLDVGLRSGAVILGLGAAIVIWTGLRREIRDL